MDRRALLRVIGAGGASLALPVVFNPGKPLVADLPSREIVTATELPRLREGSALQRYMVEYGYFREGQMLTEVQLNALLDAVLELAAKVEIGR